MILLGDDFAVHVALGELSPNISLIGSSNFRLPESLFGMIQTRKERGFSSFKLSAAFLHLNFLFLLISAICSCGEDLYLVLRNRS